MDARKKLAPNLVATKPYTLLVFFYELPLSIFTDFSDLIIVLFLIGLCPERYIAYYIPVLPITVYSLLCTVVAYYVLGIHTPIALMEKVHCLPKMKCLQQFMNQCLATGTATKHDPEIGVEDNIPNETPPFEKFKMSKSYLQLKHDVEMFRDSTDLQTMWSLFNVNMDRWDRLRLQQAAQAAEAKCDKKKKHSKACSVKKALRISIKKNKQE